jgi:opacity protein-like surface antigen
MFYASKMLTMCIVSFVLLTHTISPVKAQDVTWTGWYFGAQWGGAAADMRATDKLSPAGFFTNNTGESFGFDKGGYVLGGQLGLQKQLGNWVVGGDLQLSAIGIDAAISSPHFPASDTARMQISNLFLATGRIGYVHDRWLGYVKGGYAGGTVDFSLNDRVNDVLYAQGARHHGWTVGAGVEIALTQLIRVGVDYSYVDLGAVTKTESTTAGSVERYNIAADAHAVAIRLNYFVGHEQPYNPMK